MFVFYGKDSNLFHEFTESISQPKYNKNYIEILGQPNDHNFHRREPPTPLVGKGL
jgi:hypothetical protein